MSPAIARSLGLNPTWTAMGTLLGSVYLLDKRNSKRARSVGRVGLVAAGLMFVNGWVAH